MKKTQIVGACCIVPFVLSLLGIAFGAKGIAFAILVAIFAAVAAYGVGVLLGKFPVPFIKDEVVTESKKE